MKFSDIPFRPYNVNGAYGKTAKIQCGRGYQLSVVQIFDEVQGNSHGAEEGFYEAALLKHGEMCYDTHITGFEKKVIGFLSESDVEKLIDEVDKL
jgi:hypothetical protein